ncbi:MAG: hypothetical protein GY943_19110 [Chloroflexi bacterium]|nr:hypothetical protein [Chloroflexota bacterium]
MPDQVARKLFTVSVYDQMVNAGIFSEDERLELIEGEIVEMSPIGVRHAFATQFPQLTILLADVLGLPQ